MDQMTDSPLLYFSNSVISIDTAGTGQKGDELMRLLNSARSDLIRLLLVLCGAEMDKDYAYSNFLCIIEFANAIKESGLQYIINWSINK